MIVQLKSRVTLSNLNVFLAVRSLCGGDSFGRISLIGFSIVYSVSCYHTASAGAVAFCSCRSDWPVSMERTPHCVYKFRFLAVRV